MKPGALSTSELERPLTCLAGIGPARAQAFEGLNLATIGDLLFHVPRGVESSGRECTLREAIEWDGTDLLVFHGEVSRTRFHRFGKRNTLRLTVTC